MEKLKNYILFFISILLILVSITVTITYRSVIGFIFIPLPLDEYPWIGLYMPAILFYSSILIVFLGLYGLFVSLTYPINQKFLLIRKKYSKVEIEKKALESMLLIEIQQISFIKKANVNVKVFKKQKRMVSIVKGKIISQEEMWNELNELIHSIEITFEKMFALPKESVRLKLKLTPYKDMTKKTKNKKRVS